SGPLALADFAGYSVCHRIGQRSFSIAGRQMPLCARCTGMYLGVSLTFALLALAGRGRRAGLPRGRALLLLAGLLVVMGVDGLNSYSHFFPSLPHLYAPRNWLRLATGMGGGVALGMIVWPLLSQTLWRQTNPRPPLGSPAEWASLFGLAAGAVLLVLSNEPLLLYVLALVSALGVLAILTAIYTVFALAISGRIGQATSWPGAAGPLVAGLALALAQIGAVAFVRYSLTGVMAGLPGV
ncbi:MAG: DUF2085 domain-containing protein, partial [Candidatus Promineifilaceae bacterium]